MNKERRNQILQAFIKKCEDFRKRYVLDINISEMKNNDYGLKDDCMRLYLKPHYTFSNSVFETIKDAVGAYDYSVSAFANHVVVFFKIAQTENDVEDENKG